MRSTLLTVIIATQFALIGCASYNYTDAPSTMGVFYSRYAYIGYAGDLRPIEDVGVITTDGLIRINSLDGQPMGNFRNFKISGFYSGGRYQLHLLPGVHVIKMGFYRYQGPSGSSWSISDITKTIEISKGQVIHLSLSEFRNTWSAKELDGSSALSVIKNDYAELISLK